MASNKTANLGLDIWAEADYFKRAEVNTNFEKIDDKFGNLTESIDEKANFEGIMRGDDLNMFRNPNFDKLPAVYERGTFYDFEINVFPTREGKGSCRFTSTGYETSTDVNKDFAFVMADKMMPGEKMKVSFYAYPLQSGKTIQMRAAYTAGAMINLGVANQWNKIEFELDLASMTQGSDFFYVDFKSSLTFYMSEPKFVTVSELTEGQPTTFVSIEQKLTENPTNVKNSKGAIERLIAVGHTYWENVSKFVYGNSYTAYDKDLTLVNGKNQIDCSSFANLLVKGIPYENTRYAGKTTNKPSPLFFQNIDPYKWRYANTMAKYAVEKGYAFKPNADLSNLEAGDVLFFSWNSFNDKGTGDSDPSLRDSNFMKIDHVGVFLHRKNKNAWATLQFDNGITSVYYEASDVYMSQCVIAARFPFANVESLYVEDNILLGGETVKNVTNQIDVADYRLTKTLKKGRYYTFFIDGKVLTPNSYFILQVNGKTVYSDGVREVEDGEVVAFRFPYLLDDVTDTISLKIGALAGTDSNRSATVNWVSLYEGYSRNKKQHIKSVNAVYNKPFPLDSSLVPDLNSSFAINYEYWTEGNKLHFELNLPFNTLRTGNLVLGQLPLLDAPKKTRRLPVNAVGANGEAINAILQVASSGTVSIVNYNSSLQWRFPTVNGAVIKE